MNTSKKLALVAAFVVILSFGGHIQPVSAQPKSQATVTRQHHRMSQPQLRVRDRKTKKQH